jgi:hypothetical protein
LSLSSIKSSGLAAANCALSALLLRDDLNVVGTQPAHVYVSERKEREGKSEKKERVRAKSESKE